jgi:hypothetical protein
MARPTALALCLCASVIVVRAQQPARSADTAQREAFLSQLQAAVAADDRRAVAAMIRYPIAISIGGLRVPFADAAGVVDRYDDIFTPPLCEAIARASVQTIVRDIGISAIDGRLRITSIVVPDHTGDASPAAPAPAETARSGGARKQEPRRVAIRVGPRPTQIPGLLARGATDTLILFLPKGKQAAIRLERVPVGTATIRVVHARAGVPLGTRVSADGRFVSGRAPADGDYRIEVQRTPGADEAYLPYMLSLSLR